jgi:hypothetical protein
MRKCYDYCNEDGNHISTFMEILISDLYVPGSSNITILGTDTVKTLEYIRDQIDSNLGMFNDVCEPGYIISHNDVDNLNVTDP